MRAVVQRVSNASVEVTGQTIGKIDNGLVVLLGIEQIDNEDDAAWLVSKIMKLRIFPDEEKNMNLSLTDISGELMLVSQFTLHAKTKKGNRPSFIQAAAPECAEKLYNKTKSLFTDQLGRRLKCGKFGADMNISIINNGPVTILIDTQNKE